MGAKGVKAYDTPYLSQGRQNGAEGMVVQKSTEIHTSQKSHTSISHRHTPGGTAKKATMQPQSVVCGEPHHVYTCARIRLSLSVQRKGYPCRADHDLPDQNRTEKHILQVTTWTHVRITQV